MNKSLFVPVVIVCLLLTACYTHTHMVGDGAQGNKVMTARQWYVVFGLVPINNVDTQAMAGEAQDYEITTQQTFIDSVISMFTSAVSVSCQTVTVKK